MNGVDIEAIRNIPADVRREAEAIVNGYAKEDWFKELEQKCWDLQGEELKKALDLQGNSEARIWEGAVRRNFSRVDHDNGAVYWVHRQIAAPGDEYKKINSVFAWLEQQMSVANIHKYAKNFFNGLFTSLTSKPLNVLVVGEVGAGKSSTINALFSYEFAPVGQGIDPMTSAIEKYELGALTLWDTPGMGSGHRQDEEISAVISAKMQEIAPDGAPLIDLVLLVLDGTSKNRSVIHDILEVVTPHLGPSPADRLIVAVNKADAVAHDMEKDSGWNWGGGFEYETSGPTGNDAGAIYSALEERAKSARERIVDNSGLQTDPFCYSAGPTPPGQAPKRPYNVVEIYRRILVHNLADARPALRAMMTPPAKQEPLLQKVKD